MSTVKEVIDAYQELSLIDRLAFYSTLTGQLAEPSEERQELMMRTRHCSGIQCPFCRVDHIVKNGRRRDGTQRYLCRECGKSFLATTDSVISGIRKPPIVWKKYLHCMIEKKTLRESAADCGISMGTAFLWRHKILDALRRMDRSVVLSGTVEADETYTAVSYKGNHSKSRSFTMPRPSHRRGRDIHRQGLSSEQVCILSAVSMDRIGISGAAKPGKVSSNCVTQFFRGRIGRGTVFCTDHEKAYLSFGHSEDITLVQMETDRRILGRYGIQRINAYHSRLKQFLRHFHGVSTKYLGNYLLWNDRMFCSAKAGAEAEQVLLAAALAEPYCLRCREIPCRAAVPAALPAGEVTS